jgi:hypothetical protein
MGENVGSPEGEQYDRYTLVTPFLSMACEVLDIMPSMHRMHVKGQKRDDRK